MRQIFITKSKGREALKILESADPSPGQGEIRISVKASGVNFADVMARQGLYPDAPALPCVVGYEVSGIVDAVGAGVSEQDWFGKPVFCLTRFNGYSEKVVVPENQVFLKPGSLSFEEAASIPVTYLTAWQLLVVVGSLKKDESVLIHNAGGGVGLAAIDIAQHIGATTYGTASSGKHEFLKSRGLDFVIDYRNDDWEQEIEGLTSGKGVELITDPIGGNHWRKSMRALRATGRLGMFGISTSADKSKSSTLSLLKTALKMPFFHPVPLMNDNKGTFGVNMGHMWHEADKIRGWMDQILAGVEAGWVRPHVDSVFKFDDVWDAHQRLEMRKNIGKVILVP